MDRLRYWVFRNRGHAAPVRVAQTVQKKTNADGALAGAAQFPPNR